MENIGGLIFSIFVIFEIKILNRRKNTENNLVAMF